MSPRTRPTESTSGLPRRLPSSRSRYGDGLPCGRRPCEWRDGRPGDAPPCGQPYDAPPCGRPGGAPPCGRPDGARPCGRPGDALPCGQPYDAPPCERPFSSRASWLVVPLSDLLCSASPLQRVALATWMWPGIESCRLSTPTARGMTPRTAPTLRTRIATNHVVDAFAFHCSLVRPPRTVCKRNPQFLSAWTHS